MPLESSFDHSYIPFSKFNVLFICALGRNETSVEMRETLWGQLLTLEFSTPQPCQCHQGHQISVMLDGLDGSFREPDPGQVRHYQELLSFGCLFFKERQKRGGFRWEERWGEPREVEGRETVNRIYCMEKDLFLKKKKC